MGFFVVVCGFLFVYGFSIVWGGGFFVWLVFGLCFGFLLVWVFDGVFFSKS